MRIVLDIEVRDKPGELLKILTPIANLGANIISIIHSREERVGNRIPVRFVIDVEEDKFKTLINELEKVAIIKLIDGQKKKRYVDIVVIGHVVDTDIRDTIDRINTIGLVEDLDLLMPHPDLESSATMKILIDNYKIEELFYLLDELEKEKGLFFIKTLL